jgi:hypothetical protein
MNDDDKRERQQVTTAQLLKQAQENFPAQIELERYLAKLTRIKYLALVEEGFTESQALDLLKTWKA